MLVITAVGCIAATALVSKMVNGCQIVSANDVSPTSQSDCGYTVKRMGGYNFVKPLIYAEKSSESPRFQALNATLHQKIEQWKSAGVLQSASVYLREFQQGDWMYVNNQETFNPGSLIKVPVLMTMLKNEEMRPGFLQRRIHFDQPTVNVPTQTFNSKKIEVGKTYSLAELIEYMITYSDNEATHILNLNLDVALFKKMFVDLGLPEPDVHDPFFQITPVNYSAFFKALYNATYLNREHSDMAMDLLRRVVYQDGMVKGLPTGTTIAHKFGEGGDRQVSQLHEAGIVYPAGKQPYLLVIMTKGRDVKQLPDVLASVTRTVNEFMTAQ